MTHRWIATLCLWLLLAGIGHAGEPPALMLATPYRETADVPAYWISEKLDGVRVRWNGHVLITRGGETVRSAPAWFTRGWPAVPLDGELWMGRGRFDEVSALVRGDHPDDARWREMRLMVFDLPGEPGTFSQRLMRMRTLLRDPRLPWLRPIEQFRVTDAIVLQRRLREVVAAGGEGLMLHHQSARYEPGRSEALMKLKLSEDAEARVIAHLPGKGRNKGRLGALLVQMTDGRRFRLGTGFSDAERSHPPPIGVRVTFRYSGLTRQGLPRFARFLRIRDDEPRRPTPKGSPAD